ncbi:hypothetical protein KBA27_01340, partial [bacterium]|nr:hypothetical protein [bacterium]
LTHTIGFVFVFCNLLFVTLVLNKNTESKYKNISKNIWISIITITLICSPLIFKIFTSGGYSQWWSNFTSAKIMFMLTDFLSPVITNIVDSPTKFLTGITFAFIIFGIFPTIIAISAIINAILQKDYKVKILSATTVLAIIIVTVASMTGKLVFLTKYLIEIYPALILLVAFGFLKFNNSKVRKSLISIYIAFSLLYIIAFPTSAPKLHRGEGHKIVANLIKNAQLNKNDIVLINYYPQNRFEKYMSFNSYQVYSINKGNFENYISKENNNSKIKKDGKKIYFNQFSKEDSNYFNKIFNSEILSKLKPNQKIAILNLTSVSIYSPMKLQMLTQNPHIYNKSPFLFMVFSYLRNEELKTCMQNLKITRIETKGNWELITFTK